MKYTLAWFLVKYLDFSVTVHELRTGSTELNPVSLFLYRSHLFIPALFISTLLVFLIERRYGGDRLVRMMFTLIISATMTVVVFNSLL